MLVGSFCCCCEMVGDFDIFVIVCDVGVVIVVFVGYDDVVCVFVYGKMCLSVMFVNGL